MVLTANELDSEMLTGYEIDIRKDQSSAEEAMDVSSLHEQLVRHVLVVSGELDSRLDVWGEHSYARSRGVANNAHMRVLLAAPAAPEDDDDPIDVETVPRSPPAPPCDLLDLHDPDDPHDSHDPDDPAGEAEDWEDRLVAQAPSAAHARLAGAALGVLRDLRLERLAAARGGGCWARREGVAAAARRLRRALAPHWAGGAGWLHAALAGAPLYAEVARELRRQVPRLAARLPVPQGARADPLDAVGARRAAGAAGAWLAWAPGGGAAADARWLRRLGALVHVRALCPGGGRAGASPERWCAALAQEARAALADMLADAGRRAVIVGGVGAGAALAAWLAAGARGAGGAGGARGLLLLAPPLLTAEGPRDAPDDALADVELPLLAVVGGGAAQSWRGAAAALGGAGAGGAGAGGAGPARRVLVVAGADDALRVPRALRRRRRLPQQALDAALAEECARWVADTAEAAEAHEAPRERAGRRRAAAPAPPEYEEGRSLPTGGRSIEIIASFFATHYNLWLRPRGSHARMFREGRVVSRGPAAAPLALLPPRLAPADIMQLPIVFADDEPATPATPAAPAGPAAPGPRATPAPARAYTRVLVAKRGGGRAPAPRRRAVNSPSC